MAVATVEKDLDSAFIGGGQRTLFVAHESGPANFSVVDVTDPRRPRMLAQPRLPHDRVRSNSLSVYGDFVAVAYQTTVPGETPAGMEIFDVSAPAKPRPIGRFDTSGPCSRGAHFVWFQDGRYAFLATGMPDFEPTHPHDDQIMVIVDLANPTQPREIGRWWLPGTWKGDGAPAPERHPRWDSGFRAHNVNVYPDAPDRAYVGYLDGGIVILDIADPAQPKLVSRLDYHPPMPGFTHTVVPLINRGLLAVTDETITDGGKDAPKNLWVVHAADERKPLIIAAAPLPSTKDFGSRGGRFGMHNIHENDPVETAWRSEDILIATLFNGGVRAFNIKDPFRPEEVASLVPAAPAGSPVGAIQMNDVYVDEQEIVYAIDRFTGGLYTIELNL